MRDQTRAAIASLERLPWFKKVGLPDAPKTLVLPSWSLAIEHCISLEWENFTLELQNQYCESLAVAAPARWARWNGLVGEVRDALVPIIHEAARSTALENELPDDFEEVVFFDFVRVCMEVEYSDIRPPLFFSGLAHYYARGHFPCGWVGGPYPKGKLIVY